LEMILLLTWVWLKKLDADTIILRSYGAGLEGESDLS
jgi:hypothetical protein